MEDSFGRRLTAARIKRDWTQEELAAKSGISRGRISQLEIDEVDRPRRNTITALAKALGIEEHELADAPVKRTLQISQHPSSDLAILLERIKQLERELAREKAWTEKLWQENEQFRESGKTSASSEAADAYPCLMRVA